MQVELFPTPRRIAAAPPEPKRKAGRPPRSAEEKARIAAEKEATKVIGPNSNGRPGAGRPRHDGEIPGASSPQAGSTAHTVREYNESRATREKHAAVKEEIVAKKMALEFEVMQGNFLPRVSIISGMARAYSACSQGIRSIPDLLERRLGLDPMTCVRIGELLDDSLATLHVELERLVDPTVEAEVHDGE